MEDEIFGDVIYSYTRAQALEDGVLVDVSSLAREAGFRYPVAVTTRVWHEWVVPPEGTPGQDATGRLWDVLNVLRMEIRKAGQTDRVDFEVLFDQGGEKVYGQFYALCGPGDSGEPVITIMLPEED
jgi:hypothetical protein